MVFRQMYATVNELLRKRRDIVVRFLKSGGQGPIRQQALVSLKIRKERINRATLNHLIELIGKMDAISAEMGNKMNQMRTTLTNFNVLVHPNPAQDDITNLVYDNYRLHKCLCPPSNLAEWAATCRQKDIQNWVSSIIASNWRSSTEHIFADIPVGDHNSLYQMAYDNVRQVKTESPLTQKRYQIAIDRCRNLFRDSENYFKLICEPIDPQNQPSPSRFDRGSRYLAVSYLLQEIIQRISSDTALPSPIIDQHIPPSKDPNEKPRDEYIMYVSVWGNIHAEDLERAFSEE